MSNRKPNSECRSCGKQTYRRPWEIKSYGVSYKCSTCRKSSKINCPVCKKDFKPVKKSSKTCSRACSNALRRGSKYSKHSFGNQSRKRLEELRSTFGEFNCMIESCSYSTCFDIHRYVAGKDGGKYEIGNMFAVCPNHHAEITRKIIEVEKVNDQTLRILGKVAESG